MTLNDSYANEIALSQHQTAALMVALLEAKSSYKTKVTLAESKSDPDHIALYLARVKLAELDDLIAAITDQLPVSPCL